RPDGHGHTQPGDRAGGQARCHVGEHLRRLSETGRTAKQFRSPRLTSCCARVRSAPASIQLGIPIQQGDDAVVATTNDLKNGLVLNLDCQLWTVVEFQHVKPGKGGAFVRTTLKNVLSGKVVDRTFNAGTKVETATVDKRGMSFLYKEGTDFVFMDTDTFDQVHVPAETIGDNANYLLDNAEAMVA